MNFSGEERTFNRLHNLTNPNQGKDKRVLALCSAGLLRSPTVAWVLSNDPWNYNTRAAGVNLEYALIPIEAGLIGWADEIVCVEKSVENQLKWFAEDNQIDLSGAKIVTLKIPDRYQRRATKLVEIIKAQYTEYQHGTA
jgi:predicted protein tyrosine phosphatase